MAQTVTLRPAVLSDLGAVDRLLSRSYPRLLREDYPPSVMVLALPLITRARPSLLASGRYYVVTDAEGRIVGAGGYSLTAPAPDAARQARRTHVAHIRHFVTDPACLRQGIASAIMTRALEGAAQEGAQIAECLSTRTAVPFYGASGFTLLGPVEVPLGPGISFPAIRMQRRL